MSIALEKASLQKTFLIAPNSSPLTFNFSLFPFPFSLLTMPDIVIKAENLGKQYVIGHQAERGDYTLLRDVWMQNARTLWNKTKDLATGKPIT